ncbi:MAG: biliverdin-producing heme oxygenase [Pseudomonadota bacterium]
MSSLANNDEPIPLSQHLRTATMPQHRHTESLMDDYAPLQTAVGYRRFLWLMARLHARYAEALDRSSEIAGLPQRSAELLAALRADLGDTDALDANVTVNGNAQCMGVGYVLEGSGLGATVLVRGLPKGPDHPHAYLSLLSESVGKRWPAFKKTLDAEPLDADATAAAAAAVFNELAAMVPT